MKKYFGKILFAVIVLIVVILSVFFKIKTGLIFLSIFSLLMFFYLIATSIANALIGREIAPFGDIFWKIVFIFISSISFSISLTL